MSLLVYLEISLPYASCLPITWGVLMTEQNAVAAEQETKSSRNVADLAGKSSAILAFVFWERTDGSYERGGRGGIRGRCRGINKYPARSLFSGASYNQVEEQFGE